MSLDYNLKSVPNVFLCALNSLTRRFNILFSLSLDKTLHNEGLEQLKSHLLGETALVHFKLRAYNDNRTSGVVNTLTEQVLTEASLLTLKHIGKRLESAVVGTCNGTSASAVVNKGVYRLLKHTLLVADDDFRRIELEKLFKTVVSVDNPAVQIVEVGGRETSAVELNHRTDIRRAP